MKLHKFDPLSFVVGTLMTVVGLIFLIPKEPTGIFDGIGNIGAWLWPTLFLMVAGAVLIPLIFPNRQGVSDTDDDEGA